MVPIGKRRGCLLQQILASAWGGPVKIGNKPPISILLARLTCVASAVDRGFVGLIVRRKRPLFGAVLVTERWDGYNLPLLSLLKRVIRA